MIAVYVRNEASGWRLHAVAATELGAEQRADSLRPKEVILRDVGDLKAPPFPEDPSEVGRPVKP